MSTRSFSRRVPLLLVPCLAAALPGQGLVGLAFLAGPRPSAAFAPAALGNGITQVRQVGMVPHPNGIPGRFLGGMSVVGLSAALGGQGRMDVVAFTYDRTTDTVTLDANAAALNTANDDFALNWSASGTYAVFETGLTSYQIRQALAAAPGGLLAAPTPVAGTLTGRMDPCPGIVGGQAGLFFNDPAGLTWQPHDVPGSTVTGSPVLVATPTAGNLSHSPWPLVGADGDSHALLGCEADPGLTVSDWNFQGDLESATPAIVELPTAGAFENNGCEAGGRVYMATSAAGTYLLREFDVVGMLGDTVPPAGGPAVVTAFAPIRTAGLPDVSIVLNGLGYLSPALPIPGVINELGVNPNVIALLGTIVHAPATGRGSLTLPMPALPAGTLVTLQGITLLDSGAGPVALTNTFGILYQ